MSDYPPPTSNVTIFNPENFTSTILGVSSGSIGSPGSLNFPYAQGAETFTDGTDTLILDNGLATFSTIQSFVQSGIGLNATGFAYDNGTTTDTVTWSNLVTKVQAIGAITATSTPVSPPAQTITLNVNNTLQIQDGETATLPHPFISLSADGGDLRMNLSPNGITNAYGTAGQILTSGGSAGSLSWGSGGGASVGTLNDVLLQGKTTTVTGTVFTDSGTGETTQIQGNGIRYEVPAGLGPPASITTIDSAVQVALTNSEIITRIEYNKLEITDTVTTDVGEFKKNYIELNNSTNGTYITLDNSIGSPAIDVFDTANGNVTLSSNGMFFYSSLPNPVGISVNTTIGGLQLTTNGVLWFQGLTGSVGQVLTRNINGYAEWGKLIQSGQVLNPTYSATTAGTVTFGTPYDVATPPSVTLTVDTGTGSTSIVLAGLAGYTQDLITLNWTGFNWFISSAVPAGGTLNWFASS